MAKKISRRDFVKNSTIAGASAILGAKIISDVIAPVHGQDTPDISVAKGDNYYKNTIAAIEQLGGIQRFVSEKSKVAILANPQRNNPGSFTKPDVLRAVIKMCKDAKAKEINCISLLPEKNWQDTGLLEVVNKGGANLVIVDRKDETQFKLMPIKKGVALKEASIMKEFFKNDVFINLPITKDHAGNKFTGTLKNLMGLNSQKNNRTFHKKDWSTNPDSILHLDQSIADLNTIIKPDLCVVDATEFIITNGPFGPGKIHKPQKVVAGTDRVTIDAYCCTLWGLSVKDIIMINKAYEHNLGEIDLKKVKIKSIEV